MSTLKCNDRMLLEWHGGGFLCVSISGGVEWFLSSFTFYCLANSATLSRVDMIFCFLKVHCKNIFRAQTSMCWKTDEAHKVIHHWHLYCLCWGWADMKTFCSLARQTFIGQLISLANVSFHLWKHQSNCHFDQKMMFRQTDYSFKNYC